MSSEEASAEETPRKSARASSMRDRRADALARHRASLATASPGARLEALARTDASASASEASVSGSEERDFIDDSGEEAETSNSNESGLATGWRTVSFGSRADEALRNDDVAAFKRSLARMEDPPRPGLALMAAAAHDASRVASAFLVKGMRTSGRVEDKTSSRPHVDDVSVALHTACSKGHVGFVHAIQKMIGLRQFCRGRRGGWPVNLTGGSLVHSAVNNDFPSAECVKAAIMAESSPLCDEEGPRTPTAGVFDDDARGNRTPLMIAAGAGATWETVVWELLQEARLTNASRAVIRTHDAIEGCTAVHIAAGAGSVATLQMLIDEVPSFVDIRDFQGSTPLHHASAEGRTESIKVLLDRGANRLAVDKSGWIPLLYANFHSEREAVMHLLRADAVEQLESMLLCATEDKTVEGNSRTQVQKVFELLATIPTYYDTLNQCIATMNNMALVKSLTEMLLKVGGMTILSTTHRLSLLQLESRFVDREYRWRKFGLSMDNPWSDLLNERRKTLSLLRNGVIFCSKDAAGKLVAGGPGVTREIFGMIAKQLCDADQPQTQLFELDDSHTYSLKRGIDRQGRAEELETFGELLAYTLLHGTFLPIPFSKVFLKRVIGGASTASITIEELEDVEPQQVKSIRYVQQTDAVEELCLSFMDPKTNTQVEVTSKNKREFIQVRLQEIVSSIVDDTSAKCIKRGLLNLIEKESTLKFLTPEEFGSQIVGTHDVDAQEWRKHVDDLAGNHDQMKWFWNVITRMSAEDRSKLLQFSTGSPLLPVGGFANLQPQWRCWIDSSAPPTKLPTASTCFNTLRMAAYPSEDVLEQRLMTALRHGSTGFAFD